MTPDKPQNPFRALDERIGLLERIGGLALELIQVGNEEWLYMLLQEDARHSLAIEGFFVTEKELKEVLQGRRQAPEILNYFRTAQLYYHLAFQYWREGVLHLDLPTIHAIHSLLFQGTGGVMERFRGQAADGVPRTIGGAKVRPPLEATEYLRAFVEVARVLFAERPVLEALAKTHVLFEAIHPYRDGNGRVGRILLNYMAILKGLPPFPIKGLSEEERKRYYQALEEADRGFHEGFPPPEPVGLIQALDQGHWKPLAALLAEGLLPRLDAFLALSLLRYEDLMPLEELARELAVETNLLYQWVRRGRLIVYRQGRHLLSHPWLFLGTRAHPPRPLEALPPGRPDWPERVRALQAHLFHPEHL